MVPLLASMALANPRAYLRSTFRALQHRNYRLYWTGQLISLVGTWMQSVAQGWLMHRLTSSPLMLGLLGFMQFLPVLLLSIWAGVIVDEADKRRLLLITQTAFLIQAGLLATAVSTSIVQPWMVLALAFVFGTINAVSYVAVIVSIWRMDLPPKPHIPFVPRRAVETMLEGLRYVKSVPPLRNLLTLLGVTAGLGFQYMILLPVYARDILNGGAKGYGLLVSAFGLGSLASAVIMTRKLDRWALRRNLFVGLMTGAIGMGTFAWSHTIWLSLAMGFLAGFGLILYVATTNTLIQITTEDRYRGRVMGLYTLMFVGTAPIGALVAGTIAEHFGAPVATSTSALVLLGGAIWMVRRLRVLAAREAVTAPMPATPEKVG